MNDRELDFLLARGRLSGGERERVLRNVLGRTRPAKSPLLGVWAAALGLVGTAAVVLFVARPQTHTDSFAARGLASTSARVEAECLGASLGACPRGSHLVFRAWPGKGPGYLAAYAEPTDGGDRIWYFSAEGQSPLLESAPAAAQPLDRTIVIGPEHKPGRYTIHILVGANPLSRDEALDAAKRGLGVAAVALQVTP